MPHLVISILNTVINFLTVCFVPVLCSHVASDMAKCQGELLSKELELQRLRRDITNKTSQISHMEENLHRIKTELDSKTNLGG